MERLCAKLSYKTWFVSDTHFGHANIITFTNKDGSLVRPFSSIEEHDETIVENWNKVIKPEDRVYHLGDVVINRKHLPILDRLNGKKKLIKGNHDIFRLGDYAPYFEDILAYRIYPSHGIVCSHIPIHECHLEERWKVNCHGHLHQNLVTRSLQQVTMGNTPLWPPHFLEPINDKRYINLCMEHTNYSPVSLDEILERINE
jgi:calcineurin-like phosphoesterase family protein